MYFGINRAGVAGCLAAILGACGVGAASGKQPQGSARAWAITVPAPTPIPKVKNPAWVRNPIDAFVLHRLEAAEISPSPPAGRLTLVRRAYFDLLGLPPPVEEIERFQNDRRPDAYERLIDKLLDSPQYGERWARHWLDVVRYADSGGFEKDLYYASAWTYRDYVIRSLNSDKPFDRFIQEQVAGDELWPGNPDAVLATAMYCIGPSLAESAMVSTQLEYEWLTDAADTTGAAFLGLTFGCARCHDHKYDPLTQRDYYGMQAIFAASDRPFPDYIRQQRIKAINGLLSDVPLPKELQNEPRCTVMTESQVGFHLFHRQKPLEIHRLNRGEINKPAELVLPGLPAALAQPSDQPGLKFDGSNGRRSNLAKWLTRPNNPLTARVLVNRVWGWHFGQPIVRTPSDFGAQGDPPTHPELLDWLAAAFVEGEKGRGGEGETKDGWAGVQALRRSGSSTAVSPPIPISPSPALGCGWSLKRLHRLILLSNTYRMSSVAEGAGLKIDPTNRLLWHYPRHRLESEAIRDSMVAAAGTLNLKQFGPPVVPPLSKDELLGLFDSGTKWQVTRDSSEHTRRSIYLLVRRTFLYPLISAFDPPEVMTSCPRRMQTVVPTQALALLNSPVVQEQAAAFARRLIKDAGPEASRIAARAWQLAYGRPISTSETAHTLEFLKKRMEKSRNTLISNSETERIESAVADLALAIFNSNEFIYVD